MLAIALAFCQGLLDQNPTDRGVRWRTRPSAAANCQDLSVSRPVRRFRAALSSAVRLLEPLVKESPGESEYVRDLAGTYNNWGNLLEMKGQKAKAETYYRDAIEHFEKISKEHPQDADYRLNSAIGYNNLGILLLSDGRTAEAETAHQRAMKTYQVLVESFPRWSSTNNRWPPATIISAQYFATWHLPEAQREFREALTLFRAWKPPTPSNRTID